MKNLNNENNTVQLSMIAPMFSQYNHVRRTIRQLQESVETGEFYLDFWEMQQLRADAKQGIEWINDDIQDIAYNKNIPEKDREINIESLKMMRKLFKQAYYNIHPLNEQAKRRYFENIHGIVKYKQPDSSGILSIL